jgi:hypothetical protein
MNLNDIVRQSGAYKAVQMGAEFKWLLEKILLLERRHTAVELGVMNGGTFYAFIQLFDQAYGIDIVKRELPFPLRDQDQYIIGDSKDPEIISLFEDIDFLFIDGDHSYEGVSGDFYRWSPKVRKKGLIAFHDIKGANVIGDKYGVKKLWEEIKESYNTEEIMTHENYFGIGIIWL